MKFTPKAKDFHPAVKTESALKLQDLDLVVEELDEKAQAAVFGGAKIISASTTPKPITAQEYYKYAGYWGG